MWWMQLLFFILGYFLLFYPPSSLKNENFKKVKKTPGDIILHKCTQNHDPTLYSSWDMTYDGCNFYFSFWAIFCPFTPLKAQKNKFLKKWKNTWRHYHFTQVYQKLWLGDAWFLRYGAWHMDGQTDRQTDRKSDIYRWVPHLKIFV